MDHLLVVCTANQCRSPLAAALFRDRAQELDIDLDVSSAGTRALDAPATDLTVQVARAYGLDLSPHRSQRVERAVIAGADLVIGMERAHVRDVVVVERSAWPRTFTLKELVRRGDALGGRRRGEDLGAWLARMHDGRTTNDLLGSSVDDDVADPTGSWATDHETTARELAALVDRVLAHGWPPGLRHQA